MIYIIRVYFVFFASKLLQTFIFKYPNTWNTNSSVEIFFENTIGVLNYFDYPTKLFVYCNDKLYHFVRGIKANSIREVGLIHFCYGSSSVF